MQKKRNKKTDWISRKCQISNIIWKMKLLPIEPQNVDDLSEIDVLIYILLNIHYLP